MEVINEFGGYSRDELLDLVPKQTWVHSIDLGDGLVTPGLWSENPYIPQALSEIDFRGKKVLDIGCWDGKYSFYAEARGAAEVIASDLVSQRDFRASPLSTSLMQPSSRGLSTSLTSRCMR